MVASVFLKGLFKVISFSFLTIFIVTTLIDLGYVAITTHSFLPVLTELGNKFLLTTQTLSNLAKEIITTGGIKVTGHLFNDIIAFITTYGKFLYYFYVIFIWLKILSFIVGRMPGQSIDKVFKNWFVAILIFIIFQSFIIFGNAAVAKQVECFANCNGNGVVDYLLTPIMMFKNVFNVIPYLTKPILQISTS
jgi:hypothetical protein